MATRPDRDVAEASRPEGEGDVSLLLAESTPIADLPGLLRKTIVLGPEEIGFVTSNGNVLSQLGSGSAKVGWSLMGVSVGKREALRVHNRPFRLRLHFFNLLSKGYETLDVLLHVTVSLKAPSLFYTTVMKGLDRLTASQLATTLAAGVDDLFQVKVAATDGQALRHDQATQKQLMAELEPHLNRALEERGLHLESVDLVAFQNPGEATELLDEITEVERLIARGVKPGREDAQRLLNRLRTTGLATSDMAERAQLLFDGGTADAFFKVMKDIDTSSRRRLEAQVAERSEQLSQKLNPEATTRSRSVPLATELALRLVGPVAAVVGLLFRVFTQATWAWYALAIGLAASVLFIVAYVFVRARRLMNKHKQDEVVIRLDKWVQKNSMATDDLIRRQMGRELSNALADIKDARLTAFRQEKKEIAGALGDLENRVDLARTEVESAAAASTIVTAKRFPTQRISRLVSFEEELLRQARNLSIRSQTVKASLYQGDVDGLRTGLDHFQRTFSKRLGFLEGFKEL